MRLYILDEGPRLLPDEIPHESKGVPEGGIRIELPGDTLVRMGPMVLMCAKIFCAAASLGGNLTGIPIPRNMFGDNAAAALETATKFMAEMHAGNRVVGRRRSCQHQPLHLLFTVGGTVR